jgi:hypothetical protein
VWLVNRGTTTCYTVNIKAVQMLIQRRFKHSISSILFQSTNRMPCALQLRTATTQHLQPYCGPVCLRPTARGLDIRDVSCGNAFLLLLICTLAAANEGLIVILSLCSSTYEPASMQVKLQLLLMDVTPYLANVRLPTAVFSGCQFQVRRLHMARILVYLCSRRYKL